MSWQTITDFTVGPKLTINVRNLVAKNENQEYLRYFSDAVSSLGSTAAPNTLIDGITVTHMERKVGWNVSLTYNAINLPR
jgi:hypothetical protein